MASFFKSTEAPGTIILFTGSFIPANYLQCNHQWVEKSVYPALWDKIKDTWGESGSQFRLPPAAGRSTVGAGLGYSVGNIGGKDQETLTPAHLTGHSHPGSYTNRVNLSHSHGNTGYKSKNHSHFYRYVSGGTVTQWRINAAVEGDGHGAEEFAITNNAGNHNHSVETQNIYHTHSFSLDPDALSNDPHENTGPCFVGKRIIRF